MTAAARLQHIWPAPGPGTVAALLDWYERERRDLYQTAGTLVLCHEGCGYLHLLVVTGPARGQMWLDGRCSDQGFVPLGVGFLDWYERWLDEAMAGFRQSEVAAGARAGGKAGPRARSDSARNGPPTKGDKGLTGHRHPRRL